MKLPVQARVFKKAASQGTSNQEMRRPVAWEGRHARQTTSFGGLTRSSDRGAERSAGGDWYNASAVPFVRRRQRY